MIGIPPLIIGTDFTGSCKSNYHMITTAPVRAMVFMYITYPSFNTVVNKLESTLADPGSPDIVIINVHDP
jgi:hypothetical protein